MVKVGCVLMAAGFSNRFGADNKLLHPIDGVPMIERTMDALPPCDFDCAVVVSQYDQILALGQVRGYLPVPNSIAAEGIAASIRLGLAPLAHLDGVLFAVCDQPYLSRESVARLVSTFRENPQSIVALSHKGKRGNPAIFPKTLFPDLFALQGDRGGSGVIFSNLAKLLLVEAKIDKELVDIDQAQALAESPSI